VTSPPACPWSGPCLAGKVADGLNDVIIARRDPLTGLRNRRALDEDLELLETRVTRYGHRYCMALLDVDHFKS